MSESMLAAPAPSVADNEFVLTVPGTPVPWQAAVKLGSAPNAPRKMPGRQERHAGLIRDEARRSLGGLWLEKGTEVAVECHFQTARPKSHYGTGKNSHTLKNSRRSYERPTGRPDLSNLVKMVEDALTGEIWADDDQVVRLFAVKEYVPWWEQPRSVIRIKPLVAA